MADPNIQTLVYPLSIGPGSIKTYQTDVNKQTGSSVTYDISNVGQKDAVWRSEREVAPDGKVFYRANPVRSSYYENLSDTEKKFIQIDVAYQSDNQRAAFINQNYTQDQKNNLFPNMPRVQNTAPPSQFVTSGGSTADANGDPLTQAQQDALNVQPVEFVTPGNSRDTYGNYFYPLSFKDSREQDSIRFSMIKPTKVRFDPRFGEKTITREYSNSLGSVTLPIQPSITDSNTVDWSGMQLNALESFAAGASINLAKSGNLTELVQRGGFQLKDIIDKVTTNKEYQNAIQVALAQEAVGIRGLLSRATGSILNPNLELLFNGPQLRSFGFTFRMSSRSQEEATQVKNIIRFFKQGMSVKTTSSSVFLKSPHVFEIKYQTNGSNNHPSINRIKRCALIGCDVDYTPDGTYMTFNDEARTMTSYGLSLRFSELEPIYDSDYSDSQGQATSPYNIGPNEIGF
jgi:hypothetical protein